MEQREYREGKVVLWQTLKNSNMEKPGQVNKR